MSFAMPAVSTSMQIRAANIYSQANHYLGSPTDLKTQILTERLGIGSNTENIQRAIIGKLKETHDVNLLESCLPLLTDELVKALYNDEKETDKDFISYISDVAECLAPATTSIPDENVLLKELGSLFDFYLTVMNVFLESIYTTFGVAGEGEGNTSTFDADHRLNIMLKCLLLPTGALLLLAPAIGTLSLPVYLLLAGGLTIGFLTLLWVYKRFRPPPHSPANFINLSRQVRQGNTDFISNRPVEGRQAEIKQLTELFSSSRTSSHALTHSPTRSGKSVLAYEFARNNPDIEVYHLAASSLMNEFNFEQQFRTMRREFRCLNRPVVLCFDEVHAFFEGERKYADTFNAFISGSGISTISITTDAGYQKIQAFYDNKQKNPFFARQKKTIELKDLDQWGLHALLLNTAKVANYSYDEDALEEIAKELASQHDDNNYPMSAIERAYKILDRAEAMLGQRPTTKQEDKEREQQLKVQKERYTTNNFSEQEKEGIRSLKNKVNQAKERQDELNQMLEDFKKTLVLYRKQIDRLKRLGEAISRMDTPLREAVGGILSEAGQLYYIKKHLQPAIKNKLKRLESALEKQECPTRLTMEIAKDLLKELRINPSEEASLKPQE